MTSKKYNFRVHDKVNQKYLDEVEDKTTFLNELINKHRTGKYDDPDSIIYKIQIEKLEKLKHENRKLDYNNRLTLIREFKIAPEKAVKISSGELELVIEDDSKEKTYEPPEEKIKKTWNVHVKELRKIESGYKVTCQICDVGFLGHSTQEKAVERFKQHLEESHMEVYQK